MSEVGVVWVDDLASAVKAREWSLSPEAVGVELPAAAVAHVQGGPQLVNWARFHGYDALILLAPTRLQKQARYLANVVTGGHPGLAVAVRDTTAPALAAVTLAQLAVALRQTPTETLQVLDDSLDRSLAGVWLRRVHRLAHPAPRFAQHLHSLLVPGRSGYFALTAPSASVVRRQTVVLDDAESDAVLLVGAPEGQPLDAIRDAFVDVHVRRVDPITDPAHSYGAKGAEFLYLASRPRAVVPSADAASCPVCAAPLRTPSCPYCHVRPRLQEQTA